jgi:hypothetical protein
MWAARDAQMVAGERRTRPDRRIRNLRVKVDRRVAQRRQA